MSGIFQQLVILVVNIEEVHSVKKTFIYKYSNKMQTQEATVPKNIAAGFHALSDPLRIGTLELLRKREQCVCDLCEVLGVTQSKLSFHLKILKEAGFVNARQEGRWIYYSLNSSQFEVLQNYLRDFSRISKITPASPCSDNK